MDLWTTRCARSVDDISLIEVDQRDHLLTEQHLTLGIGKRARTQRNWQAAQPLAERELAPAIAEVALGLHLADLQPGRIFDRRQLLGERDRTGAIAAGRSGQPERVMWAQQVVAVAKAVELALGNGRGR